MSDETDANSLVPPELSFRYSDFEMLGAGGMGRVISAHDQHLAKTVAIKFLPANSDNAVAVMRFQQEAKAVSKLNHSNIVQVYDFGYTEAGEPYLVMERVYGETLEALMERSGGVLPVPQAIEIAMQLCTALEHAHANDVVHRDLKPGNIMIVEDGPVKILDFGVARILNMEETDWRLTRPGQPIGSILYMSPEQLKGEDTDARADVYSLGLVILKMVCGMVPEENTNVMRVIRVRLEGEPYVIPEVDGEDLAQRQALNQVLQKALAFERGDRYASMTELKKALADVSYQANKIAASQAKTVGLKQEPAKLKVLPLVALCLGIAALAGSVFVIWRSEEKPKHHDKPITNPTVIKEKKAEDRNALISSKFELRGDGRDAEYIADTTVTDEDLKLLASGPPIYHLRLDTGNHNVTTDGIAAISTIPLKSLAITEADINDACIPYINNMTTLQSLDLNECRITDYGIGLLDPKLPLTTLVLKNLPLQDKGLNHVIDAYPHLIVLSISITKVTMASFHRVAELHDLENLRCSSIEIRDEDIKFLPTLKHLEKLDITCNPLTTKSFETFKKIPELKELLLDYCRLLPAQDIKKLEQDLAYRHVKVSPSSGEKVFDSDMIENVTTELGEVD